MSKKDDLTPKELELVKTYSELPDYKKKEFIRFLSELSRPKAPCAVRPVSGLGKAQAVR